VDREEVAHELRTPLTTIKGVLRLLADGRLAQVAPHEVDELVERACRQLDRLEATVMRIEDEFRIEHEEHATVLYLEVV
jgi:signal transduction histidine kinase